MKIAINARHLKSKSIDGIGNFTVGILKHLVSIFPNYTFYFISDTPLEEKYFLGKNIVFVKTLFKIYSYFSLPIWYAISLSLAIRKIKPDVFIATDGMFPLGIAKTNIKVIAVIHDINFYHYPEHLPLFLNKYYNKYFPKFAKLADTIVTVSNFSKQDIIKSYGIPEKKIVVIPNSFAAQSDNFSNPKVVNKLLGSAPYFVFLGTIHPRKNLLNTIKAFDVFKQTTNLQHKLLIVGKTMWKDRKLAAVIKNSCFKDDIVFSGRVSEEFKYNLLHHSEALVFVSFFEGFGIPILEAMKAGTAIITSNTTAMPEVAKNGALYATPDNVEEIAEAMKKIATNANLVKSLKANGKEIVRASNWKSSAESFAKLIS